MDTRIIGIPASPGIVAGPAHLLVWEVPDVRHRIIPDEEIDAEIARLKLASLGVAIDELDDDQRAYRGSWTSSSQRK